MSVGSPTAVSTAHISLQHGTMACHCCRMACLHYNPVADGSASVHAVFCLVGRTECADEPWGFEAKIIR